MPSHEIKREREERKKKNKKGNEGRKERGGREMIKKYKTAYGFLTGSILCIQTCSQTFTCIVHLHKNIEEIRAHLLGEPMPRYKNNTQIMVYKFQAKRNLISGLYF